MQEQGYLENDADGIGYHSQKQADESNCIEFVVRIRRELGRNKAQALL